jgi:maltose O-acetyltransferase
VTHFSKNVADFMACFLVEVARRIKHRQVMKKASLFPGIHASVRFGPNVIFVASPASIYIGEGTYINDAILTASDLWPIRIGDRCAIGYRVSIKAMTHDINRPTPDTNGAMSHSGGAIEIGDRCWIGDNVFIREGVTLGSDVVVGANSVVTKSFPSGAVIAGVPARKIR